MDDIAVRTLQDRLEVVSGLLRALDHRVEIDAAIEEADDRSGALRLLTGPAFHFTTPQAHHILDTTLGRRTRLARAELEREQEQLEAELRRLSGADGSPGPK